MRVLVLNAGSSSLKASVIDAGRTLLRREIEWGADASRQSGRDAAVGELLDSLMPNGVPIGSIEAVGHRVVHGASRFVEPTQIDEANLTELRSLADLAPLHNPVAIETIVIARAALPPIPHVALFDTAFHATLPEAARIYPLPYEWYTDWGVRRYGFHGLSVAWSVRRAGQLLGRPVNELGLVVAHLGSGCSVTAVSGGKSVDTSMGLTPLEGLMMGTRAGSIDPGIILTLLQERRVSVDEMSQALDHGSGLLAVSGMGSDMRTLLEAAEGGNARARLAIDMFVRRAAAGIAAAASALGGLDAIVFTGGIGEHAGVIRAAIVARLAVLGAGRIDPIPVDEDRVISRAGALPAILRVEAREDLIIAAQVEEVLRPVARS